MNFIPPIVAALLHVTGSLLVVFNSAGWCARARNWNRIWPSNRTARDTGAISARTRAAAPIGQRMSALAELCAKTPPTRRTDKPKL
jgi:hypothetical protein